MRERVLAGVLTAAAIIAMQDTAVAGRIYRWADSDGQAHYSDRPPSGAHTVVREIAGGLRNPVRGQGPGLRPGEVRALEHHLQQQEHRRQERLQQRRAESASRSEQQQYCRNLREGMRNARDHSRRKHLAGKLRRDCW
jgi:hypothetical protein